MSCTVKLVMVADFETVFRLYNLVINVEISTLIAVFCNFAHKLINDFLKMRLALFVCEVSNALNPLCNITVPKEMRTYRFVKLERVKASCVLESVINGINGIRSSSLFRRAIYGGYSSVG